MLRVGPETAQALLAGLLPRALDIVHGGAATQVVLLVAGLVPDAALTALHLRLEAAGSCGLEEQWAPLLALLGRVLGDPGVVQHCVRSRYPVAAHVLRALDSGSDACRSEGYFVLLRLLPHDDTPATHAFALRPATWDMVCADVARGSGTATRHVRTNALALLCHLLYRPDASPPWVSVVDCLKAVVGAGDAQERSVACHLLMGAATHCHQGPLMLARDVAEYCLEALAVLHTGEAELRARLVMLLAQLATLDAFASHVLHALAPMAQVIEVCASSSNSDAAGAGLQLASALLRLPGLAEQHEPTHALARALLQLHSRFVADTAAPELVTWLAAADALCPMLAAQPDGALLLKPLVQAVASCVQSIIEAPSVDAQLLAVAIRVCSGDEQRLCELASRHESFLVQPQHVATVALALFGALGSLDAASRSLYAICFRSFFVARAHLRLRDPVLGQLAGLFVGVTARAAPWWPVSNAAACAETLLCLSDPEAWPDQATRGGNESASHLIVLLLAVCSSCSFNPLTRSASQALLSMAWMRNLLAAPVNALPLAVLLTCTPGCTMLMTGLAELLARGIASTHVKFSEHMPRPLLAWAFGVAQLNPLTTAFVRALVETNNVTALLLAGPHVVGPMLRLLDPTLPASVPALAMQALDAFMGSSDEHATLVVLRGIGSVLLHFLREQPPLQPQMRRVQAVMVLQLVQRTLQTAVPSQRAACIELMLLCGSALPLSEDQGPDADAQLAWFNVANTLAAEGGVSDWTLAALPAWASLLTAAERPRPTSVLLSHLQCAGLLLRHRAYDNESALQLLVAAVDMVSEPSLHCAAVPVVPAALFVVRSALPMTGGLLQGTTQHHVWLTLLACQQSPQEGVRLASALCVATLLRDASPLSRLHLLEQPWTVYCCRTAIHVVMATALGESLPASLLTFLSAILQACDEDSLPSRLLSMPFVSRVLAECSALADHADAVCLDVLVACTTLLALDPLVCRAAKDIVAIKLGRMTTHSPEVAALPPLDAQGARVWPWLLWAARDNEHGRQREDRLHRINSYVMSVVG